MEKSTTAANILTDKTKIDQLTKYLTISLEAHRQGNPKQLTQIFEELDNEKADTDSVRVWLSIFTKTLIESMSQPSIDCSSIIDFILNRSRWLTSNSKHLQVFDAYGKFVLALVSIKNSYLPLIMKQLAQNLVPKEMFEDATKAQNFNIVIGHNSFKSLHDLKLYVTAIIKNNKYDPRSVTETVALDQEHTKFLHELFTYHPKSKHKLKGFSKLLVGYNTMASKPTKCFFIEKENGDREDISYLKACNGVYDALVEQNLHNLLNNEQETLLENILNFLVKILKLYPLSLSQLPTVLREVFPHRRLDDNIQRIFFMNVLRLAIKFDKLRIPILNICVEKLIQIDVEIKPGYKGHIKNEFSLEMAKKLDWVVLVFLDYFDYSFDISERNSKNCFGAINKRPEGEKEAKKHSEKLLTNFCDLLDIFQANLLMTYQSKYVQFIFFYLCSYVEIYPDFAQHFLSRLITNIQSEEEKKFVKINSAHYLRSLAVRAKYLSGSVIQKAVGYMIDYLKKYIKATRQKLAHKNSLTKDKLSFEKIELDASSKYKDILMDPGEQESEYKQLYQKYDIFYYINYAIIYIYAYDNERFNDEELTEYKKYTDILVKYDSFFKILKFIPKAVLIKFKDSIKTENSHEELPGLLEEELRSIEEEKTEEVRGEVFLEAYLPFDPNFLHRSKKALLSAYNFIGNEEEDIDSLDEIGEDVHKGDGNHYERRLLDTLDDEGMSDNLSSMSKHETDDSNEQVKKAMEESLKRKSKPFKGVPNPEKKVKTNSLYVDN